MHSAFHEPQDVENECVRVDVCVHIYTGTNSHSFLWKRASHTENRGLDCMVCWHASPTDICSNLGRSIMKVTQIQKHTHTRTQIWTCDGLDQLKKFRYIRKNPDLAETTVRDIFSCRDCVYKTTSGKSFVLRCLMCFCRKWISFLQLPPVISHCACCQEMYCLTNKT